MKNNNVLKTRRLHNHGIVQNFKNFDILSEFLLEEFSDSCNHSYKFSAIGFDFDSDNFLRQIQPMEGYDLFEVLKEVYHNSCVYGEHFCILHHDLNGFHYICY